VRTPAGQISPDKNVNFRYTTAAFTLSPESGASLCCANSTGDWALYAVYVRRLIALRSGLPLPLVVLACGSPYASLQPFRPFLTETPLPSANTFVNVLKTLTLTEFTYRGLSPHKFTPMPGVHKTFAAGRKKPRPLKSNVEQGSEMETNEVR